MHFIVEEKVKATNWPKVTQLVSDDGVFSPTHPVSLAHVGLTFDCYETGGYIT